jgi:hypothetical protein
VFVRATGGAEASSPELTLEGTTHDGSERLVHDATDNPGARDQARGFRLLIQTVAKHGDAAQSPAAQSTSRACATR